VVTTALTEHVISHLAVVVCPTWSTCYKVQLQKVLADVAFDVVRHVSEALVQEL